MGEPVRIMDLARDLIRLAGRDPDSHPIKFVGLRPGEKLHEELFYDRELAEPTSAPKVMRVDASLPPESLRADIGQLIALASGDEEERLKVAVIEYTRSLETRDDARPVGEEADPAWIATEHVLADAPGRVLAALREGLPVLAGSEAPVGV
jgi:FlaA1/EpsC-like NDP-sugar epimerase